MRKARRLSTIVLLGLVMILMTACGSTGGDSKELGDAITSFFKWIGDPRQHGMFATETLQSLLPGYLAFYLLFVLFGAFKGGAEILGARRRQAKLEEITPIFFRWIAVFVLTLGFVLLNANLTEIAWGIWEGVGLDNIESIRKSLGLILPGESGFDLAAVLKSAAAGAVTLNLLSVGSAISCIAAAFTISALYEALIGIVYEVLWMPVVFTTGKLRFLLIPLSTVFMWFVYGILLGSAFLQNPNNPTMVMLWMIVAPVLAVTVPAFVIALVIWSLFWNIGGEQTRASGAEERFQDVGGIAGLAALLKAWQTGGKNPPGDASSSAGGGKPPPPPAPSSSRDQMGARKPTEPMTQAEKDGAIPGEWISFEQGGKKRRHRSPQSAPPPPVADSPTTAANTAQASAADGSERGQARGGKRTSSRAPAPPPPPVSDTAGNGGGAQSNNVVASSSTAPSTAVPPPVPSMEDSIDSSAPPSPTPGDDTHVWRAKSLVTDEGGHIVAQPGEPLFDLGGDSTSGWTKGGARLTGEIEEV